MNAVGSWEATTGLAEAGRRCVGALVDAGVDVAMDDYNYGAPRDPHRLPFRLRVLPRGRPHDVDLCFLNVNELHLMPVEYLHRPSRRRVIAYWHWEQGTLPEDFQTQLDHVDEIWVSSEFSAATFRHYTSKPVEVVPCVVEPVADTSLGRASFGLPEGSCLFFFHFDVDSTLARKNPRGVIEAYRRAFTPAERANGVHLVMKTINLANHPEAQAVLEDAMGLVGGTILDVDLPPEAVAALTAVCDVYVSLHRAEGFGLGMAEAMYFGKPVIATAYSGNMDFMTLANSCPVGYRMARIDLGDLRFNRLTEAVYRPGEWWADPDLDEAARRMPRPLRGSGSAGSTGQVHGDLDTRDVQRSRRRQRRCGGFCNATTWRTPTVGARPPTSRGACPRPPRGTGRDAGTEDPARRSLMARAAPAGPLSRRADPWEYPPWEHAKEPWGG